MGTGETYDGYQSLLLAIPLHELPRLLGPGKAPSAMFTLAAGTGSLTLDGPMTYVYDYTADSVTVTQTRHYKNGGTSVEIYALRRGATGPLVSMRRLTRGKGELAYEVFFCSVSRREAMANRPQVLAGDAGSCVPNAVSDAGVLATNEHGTLRLITGLSSPVQVQALGEDGKPTGPAVTAHDGQQGSWWPSDASWVVVEDQSGRWAILE